MSTAKSKNTTEPVIEVKNVSKFFKLPHERKNSFKQHFVGIFSKKSKYEKFEALKNIDFTVNKGDFFGIVGRNGSGKSTLLKIISGIYQPTSGSVKINGTLTPFIELGIGFNPELTGRENVYLNGSILGLTKKQINDLYDDIVEFAELGRFMDQRLKNYSSGMQVRLAFSIAIRAQNDILLLDEVLAVGDINFQKKCFEYFQELKRLKKTVVFVSHDMSAVQEYCTKAILITDSKLVYCGDPKEVASKFYDYMNLNDDKAEPDKKSENKKISTEPIDKPDDDNKVKVHIRNKKLNYKDPLVVDIEWGKSMPVKNVGMAIFNDSGAYIHGNNSILQNYSYAGKNKATIEYKLGIASGKYFISIGLFGNTDKDVIKYLPNLESFNVYMNQSNVKDRWHGIINLETEWK